MFYHIKDTLIECDISELKNTEFQYVSVLTKEEWIKYKDCFDLGIDMELDLNEIHSTKAVVNYDSLTGTFMIPDRNNITEQYYKFTFVLDEKGIVFIDDNSIKEDSYSCNVILNPNALNTHERARDYLMHLVQKGDKRGLFDDLRHDNY